jgi:hypothetical protein
MKKIVLIVLKLSIKLQMFLSFRHYMKVLDLSM